MDPQSTIIITGAAGFIGSCMVQFLNNQGCENLILVDDFNSAGKQNNWINKKYKFKNERSELFEWVVKLFKSHRPDFEDGQQRSDFVYVINLLKVMYWMTEAMIEKKWLAENNGLYNLGTGEARSFYDLVSATFNGLDSEPNIVFIDMPEDIRDKYQYFTEANMSKLYKAGYDEGFYTLEEGVDDYVRNYLSKQNYY